MAVKMAQKLEYSEEVWQADWKGLKLVIWMAGQKDKEKVLRTDIWKVVKQVVSKVAKAVVRWEFWMVEKLVVEKALMLAKYLAALLASQKDIILRVAQSGYRKVDLMDKSLVDKKDS